MDIVIVGNGAAGIMTAAAVRNAEAASGGVREPASIRVLAAEGLDYYARPRLPEAVARSLAAADLALFKPDWYAAKGVEVLKGARAAAVDRGRKELRLADGRVLRYDKLVLAVGADAARLAVPGADLAGVFAVREWEDAAALADRVRAERGPAVVLGGGLLGLELARAAAEAGASSVTVVEAMGRLLPRQLDAEGAAVLAAYLESIGVRTIVGATAARIEGGPSAERVVLSDGRVLPASAVVMAAGIVPRVSLAKEAGLAVARGVVVDERLATSDPDVFAVGDCAEFRGSVVGMVAAALEQAPVCAAALLGRDGPAYAGTRPRAVLKIAGIDVASCGAAAEDSPSADVRRYGGKAARYEKYAFEGGILTGAIVVGSRERASKAAAALGKAADPDAFRPADLAPLAEPAAALA